MNISFFQDRFNADVAMMMKMWGKATSNQGGRGLAGFVGTMNNVNTSIWQFTSLLLVINNQGQSWNFEKNLFNSVFFLMTNKREDLQNYIKSFGTNQLPYKHIVIIVCLKQNNSNVPKVLIYLKLNSLCCVIPVPHES